MISAAKFLSILALAATLSACVTGGQNRATNANDIEQITNSDIDGDGTVTERGMEFPPDE
jgi:hypothetical protein